MRVGSDGPGQCLTPALGGVPELKDLAGHHQRLFRVAWTPATKMLAPRVAPLTASDARPRATHARRQPGSASCLRALLRPAQRACLQVSLCRNAGGARSLAELPVSSAAGAAK
jgi:hypothetical protein